MSIEKIPHKVYNIVTKILKREELNGNTTKEQT